MWRVFTEEVFRRTGWRKDRVENEWKQSRIIWFKCRLKTFYKRSAKKEQSYCGQMKYNNIYKDIEHLKF